MISTNKRIKLDSRKLVGFNQQKSLNGKPGIKAIKAMVGTKADAPVAEG
jgi:hypothetical protein